MKKKELKLPEHLESIMVTYKKDGETITKRGFYYKYENHFVIPPGWAWFNGAYLPNGFGGSHIKPENVIKWEPCKDGN